MKKAIFVKTYCAIRNGANQIIMTQDKEGQPGWKFPGGHVEEKELILEGIKREILEEIGIKIEITDILLIEDYFNKKRPSEHNVNFFFVANKISGQLKPKKDEVLKIKTFGLAEIKNLKETDLYPPHLNAILQLTDNHSKLTSLNLLLEK